MKPSSQTDLEKFEYRSPRSWEANPRLPCAFMHALEALIVCGFALDNPKPAASSRGAGTPCHKPCPWYDQVIDYKLTLLNKAHQVPASNKKNLVRCPPAPPVLLCLSKQKWFIDRPEQIPCKTKRGLVGRSHHRELCLWITLLVYMEYCITSVLNENRHGNV